MVYSRCTPKYCTRSTGEVGGQRSEVRRKLEQKMHGLQQVHPQILHTEHR